MNTLKCICINDKNRPEEIPESHWVKKGEEYTLLFARFVLPQRTLAFQLNEIMLDESCAPYEYFLANRFAFRQEDIQKLIDFIQDCNDMSLSMKELLEKTEVLDYDLAT